MWQCLHSSAVLFPIPIPMAPYKSQSPSSRIMQRYKSKIAIWKVVCNMIASLNALDRGRSRLITSSRIFEKGSSIEQSAWGSIHRRLFDEAKSFQMARRSYTCLSGVQALKEVLKSAASEGYSYRHKVGPHATLSPYAIDEPKSEHYVDMLQALDVEESSFL